MNTLNKTAGKAEQAPVPRGDGWEDPNQKWSGMWLFAVLIMIPIDAVVAYFTRNWGIFQWLPGLILGGYTLQFFLNIFIPTKAAKADLRTEQQKLADAEAAEEENRADDERLLFGNFGLGPGYVNLETEPMTELSFLHDD